MRTRAGAASARRQPRERRAHAAPPPLFAVRALPAGKDKDDGVVPKIEFSLDSCIEYIQEDELVEVTPLSVRMLKNPDMAGKRKK